MQVGTREADARSEGQRAAMDVVSAVTVDEIRETRRAADARDRGDVFTRDLLLPLLHQLEVQRQHAEIAAARAPRRMVRGHFLLREWRSFVERRNDRRR